MVWPFFSLSNTRSSTDNGISRNCLLVARICGFTRWATKLHIFWTLSVLTYPGLQGPWLRLFFPGLQKHVNWTSSVSPKHQKKGPLTCGGVVMDPQRFICIFRPSFSCLLFHGSHHMGQSAVESFKSTISLWMVWGGSCLMYLVHPTQFFYHLAFRPGHWYPWS